MLSFPMFALPVPRKAFTALRISSSFTSLTSSTSRSSAHAQQTPHLLSSDRSPAPTRHTRHAETWGQTGRFPVFPIGAFIVRKTGDRQDVLRYLAVFLTIALAVQSC